MADAQASGACGSNIVWVQVPLPALFFLQTAFPAFEPENPQPAWRRDFPFSPGMTAGFPLPGAVWPAGWRSPTFSAQKLHTVSASCILAFASDGPCKPNRSPAERVRFGEEAQRREQAFASRRRRGIQSLRRRQDGERSLRITRRSCRSKFVVIPRCLSASGSKMGAQLQTRRK